jgi:transcriptional regulator with PAS, ATPase and Fis domain
MNLQSVKQRFEIIGNSRMLNLALETAMKVSPTDITVLINGESGVGKEAFSKIIHQLSNRKHGNFIAINCGAIPEGTIDSELFGHEKGAFTGAHDTRKGYFETVSGGTIFLDEVGELPLETQARLLRVLETGEFIKVGSSKAQKTDVRVVAATNKDLQEATEKGKFREDLYYRLSTVPIKVPPLRSRGDDVYLLFLKFTDVFSEKYRTDPIVLDEEAKHVLMNYRWPGNIRQMRNLVEQLSVLEAGETIDANKLLKYLPNDSNNLPVLAKENSSGGSNNFSERDIFYKVLFDLRNDVMDLKKVVLGLVENVDNGSEFVAHNQELIKTVLDVDDIDVQSSPANRSNHTSHTPMVYKPTPNNQQNKEVYVEATDASAEEENLSLEQKEKEMISKALTKHKGRRKKAANELGISERTLYRKIKQYDIE